jgi:hypothetical protein
MGFIEHIPGTNPIATPKAVRDERSPWHTHPSSA